MASKKSRAPKPTQPSIRRMIRKSFAIAQEDNHSTLKEVSGTFTGRLVKGASCQSPLELVLEKTQPSTATDNVNHPPHYTAHPSVAECITVTEHFNFNVGNAIKYLWRSSHKGGVEDLKKAEWYVKREIQRLQTRGVGA